MQDSCGGGGAEGVASFLRRWMEEVGPGNRQLARHCLARFVGVSLSDILQLTVSRLGPGFLDLLESHLSGQ